ncbi:MAG: hypothetical protein QME25_07715 [Bacteroidota bacterium]|nr:hypothetical protein [Bacteroidota bacterium]
MDPTKNGMANVVVAATHRRGMFKAPLTVFAPSDTIYPGDTNNI